LPINGHPVRFDQGENYSLRHGACSRLPHIGKAIEAAHPGQIRPTDPPDRSARQMQEECAYDETSADACACAETVHLSALYRMDVPYSQRYFSRAQKPGVPAGMGLVFRASTRGRQLSETIQDRFPGAAGGRLYLRKYATRQIQLFTHARDGVAIAAYVDEYFDPIGPAGLDIPLAVYLLIARGIEVFTTHRR
jgi:hypothetical protein